MLDATALLDIHDRAHRSLAGLLAHVAGLDPADLDRELPGFGYPSIRQQLHHALGAERYWIGVLAGSFVIDDDGDAYPDAAALQRMRREVSEQTTGYLRRATATELNEARPLITWGGRERVLVPAHVVMRTVTHLFQHQGQVTAMCRLLGQPVDPGLDYPHGPPA